MLAALISGRAGAGGNYAKKMASGETQPDLKSDLTPTDHANERVTKGTALSVFKKNRGIAQSSDNNKLHSPPQVRRES